MKLPTEIFGDVVVVHTPEDLGEEIAEQFENFIDNLGHTKVIVDLNGTESIDSTGLTALLNVQDSLRESDGDVRISTDNIVNRKILEITRLDQRLDVFESVIDAVKSFA